MPITIDCQYTRPEFAAAFLVAEPNRGLFVENNTSHSVPLLLEALRTSQLKPEQVEYLIVTHVHLDHAGGSSALIQACPHATLLAHPRAAVHLKDPSKLVGSARKVYGDTAFDRLYGRIEPIPASRVREMQDGEEIQFGSRCLRFIYTRGHANHHFCIFDSGSEGVFTGDSFGLAYPALQRNGLFIFPSTSPTDFNPEEARISIQKILKCGAKRAYLTHFGELTELQSAAEQLNRSLDFSEDLLERAFSSSEPDDALNSFCEKRLRKFFQTTLEEKGLASDSDVWNLLKMDLELNAAGIAHVARKKRSV